MKGTVLDQFGEQAAVVAVVDLLGHQAVEAGRYGRTGFVDLDVDGSGYLCQSGRDRETEAGREANCSGGVEESGFPVERRHFMGGEILDQVRDHLACRNKRQARKQTRPFRLKVASRQA